MKNKSIYKCKSLGVMLLDCGNVLRVDAPNGKVFESTGLHYLDFYLDGWLQTHIDAYRELLGQLKGGLAECDNKQCEVCEEALSFDEAEKLYQGERLA